MASDPNRAMLLHVAKQLGPLRNEVVFIGGTVVGLLLSDPAAPSPRPTRDVDVVVYCDSWAAYHGGLRERLLAAGFVESAEPGDPICAWRAQGIRVDVMPTESTILGFSNRWYASAVQNATRTDIGGIVVRLVDAPHLVATKLEAFKARGQADFYASHDLEDISALVDGRPELVSEVATCPPDVHAFISAEFKALLANEDFINALPGHLADANRERIVLSRWQTIARSQHAGSTS